MAIAVTISFALGSSALAYVRQVNSHEVILDLVSMTSSSLMKSASPELWLCNQQVANSSLIAGSSFSRYGFEISCPVFAPNGNSSLSPGPGRNWEAVCALAIRLCVRP